MIESVVAVILSSCSAPTRHCPFSCQDKGQPGCAHSASVARHVLQDPSRHLRKGDARAKKMQQVLQPMQASVDCVTVVSSSAVDHATPLAACHVQILPHCFCESNCLRLKPTSASQPTFHSLSLAIHSSIVDEHIPLAPAPREHFEEFYGMHSTRPLSSSQARDMAEYESYGTVHRMLQIRGFAPALRVSQGKCDVYQVHHDPETLEPLSPSARLNAVLDLLMQ